MRLTFPNSERENGSRPGIQPRGLKAVFTLILAIVLVPSLALGADKKELIAKAKKFYKEYVELQQSFAPRVYDLYDEDIIFRNVRHLPDGEDRAVEYNKEQLGEALAQALPSQAARGEALVYSEATYAVEKDRVRIKCTRSSEKLKYTSKVELLVGPDGKGDWKIFSETSESRPQVPPQ